ncbi:MAG: hypothetical protein ACRCXX_14110 [Cetobacterium sp.]|uniref:hypothetical protein n=1 Tax=Cetobacterium sp. TaxID=2071632 RepID=UPI003F34345F
MWIVKARTPEIYWHEETNSKLKELSFNSGFYKVYIKSIPQPEFLQITTSSILIFKRRFGLDFLDNSESEMMGKYLNLITNFIEYNDVSDLVLKSEVISTLIASLDHKMVLEFFKNFGDSQIIDIFLSSDFRRMLEKKATISSTVNDLLQFMCDVLDEANYKKITATITEVPASDNPGKIKTLFDLIVKGLISRNEIDEFSGGYDANITNMSSEEKAEWLKKYSPQSNLFVIDVANMTNKVLQGVEYNTLFNPEFGTLERLSQKYMQFVSSINMSSQNCSFYKTIVYLSIFLARDKMDIDPTIFMKKLINRDTRWATETEKTTDPSFYGSADIWKMFYGYGPFMTGEKNPFRDIIDNTQVDDMDRQAILMHKWFKENGLSEVVYQLIYEKGLIGDHSIYDLISMTKDLIALIEEPIVASSAIDNLTNSIKGIVSGMINSFVSTIDISISGVARKLFYQPIIPINGKKISISEFHDYVAFVSSILKMYEKGAPTTAITKESFANQIYAKLSGNTTGFEKIGYGAFDPKLNLENNLTQYEKYFYEVEDKDYFYLSKHMKTIHALVMFAIQKKIYKFGPQYDSNISYGSDTKMQALIRDLTDDEIFFVLHNFKVEFSKFNSYFKKYDISEIRDFNNNLIDAQLYLDLDKYTCGFYKDYLGYDKNILSLEMSQTYFSTANYKTYINKSLSVYFKIVSENKVNLTKAVLDANNVSDVDDFLMRFLPSFEQLSKTLGYNSGTISQIIYVLDYICEFITTTLFKKMFVEIKSLINDYVKNITESLFQVIDHAGDVLGGSGTMVIKFEFGGKLISGKLDSLLKVLDDFTLTTQFLDKCFTDPSIYDVNIDSVAEGDFTGDGKSDYYDNGDITIDIVDKENDDYNSNINGEIFKPDNEDNKITITIVDKNKDKGGTIEKVIESVIAQKDPPKYISYDKGSIVVTTESGKKVTIITNDDKKNNGNSTITEETYSKIESEIISKNEIDQFIEIRDFITNITNQHILDLQNKLNSVKKDIEVELNKGKPNNSTIKDLVEREKELIAEIDKVKESSNIRTSGFSESNIATQDDEVVFHDFSNGEINLDKISGVLGDLNDFSTVNKIPLTTSQIMELLK